MNQPTLQHHHRTRRYFYAGLLLLWVLITSSIIVVNSAAQAPLSDPQTESSQTDSVSGTVTDVVSVPTVQEGPAPQFTVTPQAVQTYTVTNANDSGAGSLRDALTSVAALPVSDSAEITIDLPAAPNPATLSLASALPDVGRQVSIEVADTNLIIDGSGIGSDECLVLPQAANNSTVEDLIFAECETAILVEGQVTGVTISNVTIYGGTDGIIFKNIGNDFGVRQSTISSVTIGFDANGDAAPLDGIGIDFDSSTTNTISEVFVGNAATGVYIREDSNSNTVTGSVFGTNQDREDHGNTIGMIANSLNNTLGTEDSPNTFAYNGIGLQLQSGALTNTVTANSFVVNTTAGIDLVSAADNVIEANTVQQNGIGIRVTGGSGNSYTDNTVSSNTNGVVFSGGANRMNFDENTVNDNTGNGVQVTGSTTETITLSENAIYSNGDDISLDDSGNAGVASPTISSATTSEVSGTSGTSGTVEVFTGAGQTFVGSATVSNGAWSLSSADMSTTVSENDVVIATYTDSDGNTSDYSSSATVELPTTTDEFASLDTSYINTTTLNGRALQSATTNVNLRRGPVLVGMSDVTTNHEVRLIVKDSNGDVAYRSDWLDTAPTVSESISGLARFEEYSVYSRSREAGETLATEQEQVATFTKTYNPPAIQNVEGSVTVTANPQALTFSSTTGVAGVSNETVNISDGNGVVATCANPCQLPFALEVGEYAVEHTFTKNGFTSAPAEHDLVVTRPNITTALTLDARDSRYFTHRIVTSSSVQVAGIAPANTTVTLSVNGVQVGQTTTGAGISWVATMDLSAIAKGDYYLTVSYTNSNGDTVQEADSYAFKYADTPINPLIQGVPLFVERGAAVAVDVTGGRGYIARAYNNTLAGTLASTATLSNTGSLFGTGQITLPATTTGEKTLVVQLQDSDTLLKSQTATVTYTVVEDIDTVLEEIAETPATTTTPDETTGSTGQETTDTGNTDTTGNTQTGTTQSEEQAAQQQALAEQKVVQERLESDLRSADITIEQRVVNAATEEILEQYDLPDDVRVLTKQSSLGLRPLSFLPWTAEQTRDVFTVSGVTDPFATVTLTIRSDPIVTVAKADENGEWKISVPVDLIPEGEHTAYLQAELDGVKSEEIEIAKFVVVEERSLSNTTWIFIINIIVVAMIGLGIFWLQFQKKQTSYVSSVGTASQGMSFDVPDDDDDDQTGGALGV